MNRRRFLAVLGWLLLAPALLGAGRWLRVADGRKRGGDAVNFNAVSTGEATENECSPELEDDFRGLRINMPERVRLGADKLVVCGSFQFDADYVYTFNEIHAAVVIVAVDVKRHIPYACNIVETGGRPRPSRPHTPRRDPDWMANHVIGSYFNVNLLRHMKDLPRVSADYFVYAMIEDHVSNVRTVSVTA